MPYLGTFLTDLTMVDTAFRDTTDDGLINFDKRRREFEILTQIKLFQSAASLYHILPDAQFSAWFQNISTYDDKERSVSPSVNVSLLRQFVTLIVYTICTLSIVEYVCSGILTLWNDCYIRTSTNNVYIGINTLISLLILNTVLSVYSQWVTLFLWTTQRNVVYTIGGVYGNLYMSLYDAYLNQRLPLMCWNVFHCMHLFFVKGSGRLRAVFCKRSSGREGGFNHIRLMSVLIYRTFLLNAEGNI